MASAAVKKLKITAKRKLKNTAIEKAPKPTTDPKAWAKKIIANPKNYPSISLKTAKEALSIRDVRV